MKKLRKHFTLKRSLIGIYLLALIGTYFFVNSALKEDSIIKAVGKEERPESIDIKPVDITLNIDFGDSQLVFEERMENSDTVEDILKGLRNEGALSFEALSYRYGKEIDIINGTKADENNKWKVFMLIDPENAEDTVDDLNLTDEEKELILTNAGTRTEITHKIESVKLVDSGEYFIEFTRNEAHQ